MPLTLYPRTTEPGEGPAVGGPVAELSPALREELLDPAAWRDGLEQCARAMRVAVSLMDADGRPLGPCLNPQPLWELLRRHRPAQAGECLFVFVTRTPCTCVADALKNGTVAQTRDRTGLVHFAVPLILGGEKLGVLVAGQVFDRYPEQLELEHVARMLGVSPAKAWEIARRQLPVSPSMLQVYKDLLVTFGGTFLQGRYQTLLEAARLAELRRAKEELRQANAELEYRVEERTAELRESQTRALRAERLAAIGQMVAGLAHESRNALQRIQAGISRLGFRLQNQPEALTLLNNIQMAQDDLHRLFDELREYAAPIRLDPLPCNLGEVWREAWTELDTERKGREAELREEASRTDLRCVASPFHLKQVFRNLLHNALSAGRGPVGIVIRCSEAEVGGKEGVRIAVRDNGPGFAQEAREKAFEPFFTTKTQGTGLGLAICKRIVEAHGGKIELGTDAGPGGEVVLTLPRRAP